MMREIVATAMFMLVAVAVMSAPNVSKTEPDSITKAKAQTSLRLRTDSILLKAGEDPDFTSYNVTLKQRLDSIQMSVPLTYNKYVNDYIDLYISRPTQIGKMLGLSKYYFPIYEKIFKENNIPDEIKFLSIVESSLDPNAVSRSGATGLWQFMYTTAKGYHLKMDNYIDERKDPIAASYAAAMYFRDAFAEFGDWLLAIAAYNCGRGAVSRAIAKAGGVKDFWAIRPYLPLETRNYVPAFIATTYIMNHYLKHNISTTGSNLPSLTDVIQVNTFVSLTSIAKATNLDINLLKILNPAYKKQIINGAAGEPKALVIPVLDEELYGNLYNALNSFEEAPKIILASTKTEKKPSPTPAYHKVRAGENLSIIANRYRIEVQDLKVWNKLKSSLIIPGQFLQVTSGKIRG